MSEPIPEHADRRTNGSLLDPDFMARLEQLAIVSRKIHASRRKGERKSKRRGESAEFADYRNYVVGDDLRHVDWNIYARLDRLFLKMFLEEEDLNVSVLIDVSHSMDAGQPSKALFAKRVAASVAYIGLCNTDRVNLCAYADSIVRMNSGLRGRRQMPHVVRFLEELPLEGGSRFAVAARQFALRQRQKGVVLILSDFMDKGGWENGLRFLIGREMDIYAIQILSPQEVNPDFTGDLKLVDCEDDEAAEVSISKPLIDKYKAGLHSYCEAIRSHCMSRGVTYHYTLTTTPFESLILKFLRQRGLFR
ncbi:MAG: DUF58 domain-containing protein [Phycisphaerae bacterium]|nr:DUF58 domain-containing protein [Phycisphaerae bacterium]